ncbi:hypothetical protein ACO2Q8_00415 [Larkinella sp. VNQ87]|uniref:hypothetical protein n=1 Tax=Larkinella sp. VNQ87 TaxID=3400921 RepID=UPI003C095C4A
MTRIRLVFLLFIFVASVSACKKSGSGEDVDPREQYLGVYDIDYSSKTSVTPGWPTYSEDAGEGTITITKADGANEMSLLINFDNYSSTELVKLNGSEFTMNRTRDNLPFGNKVYDGEFTGTGRFEGNTITMNSVTKVSQNGGLVEWKRAYKGSKR